MDKEGDRRSELANHLGNVLAVISDRKLGVANGNGTNYTSFEAITISATDYFPFGMSMPGRSFTAQNTEGYRYSFNGQEKDNELGSSIFTAEHWEYDARLGRRWNRDPKPETSISVYACLKNNPIWLNDIAGDSAWTVTNQWNDSYIQSYNTTISEKAAQYVKEGKKFTCEDFALSTAIDFAKDNQLPFQFTNGTGTYDAATSKYNDFETFKNDVLKSSAAPDLQNDLNTTSVAFDNISAGTIFLNRNSEGRATHVQMVSSVKANLGYKDGIKTVNIVQGNSGLLNGIPGGSRLGGGNPQSMLYTGTTLERGFYLPQANYYENTTTGKSYINFSEKRNLELRRFNFKEMNVTGASGNF